MLSHDVVAFQSVSRALPLTKTRCSRTATSTTALAHPADKKMAHLGYANVSVCNNPQGIVPLMTSKRSVIRANRRVLPEIKRFEDHLAVHFRSECFILLARSSDTVAFAAVTLLFHELLIPKLASDCAPFLWLETLVHSQASNSFTAIVHLKFPQGPLIASKVVRQLEDSLAESRYITKH
jgi:hypothetical protein